MTIIGIAGGNALQTVFTVNLADDMGLRTGTTLTAADFEFTPASGKGTDATNVISAASVTVGNTATKTATGTVTIGRNLEPGDRLTLKPNKVADTSGNMNVRTSRAAIRAEASPRVTSVQMSNLKHTVSNVWTVPESLVGGATGSNALQITTKTSGDAAGAADNDWVMLFDRASSHSAAKPLDIAVSVSPKSKRVSVVFKNGPATATLGDLLKAMNDHSGFAERFTASFATCANAGTGARVALGLLTARDQVAGATGAGRSQFALEVRFDRCIATVTGELVRDLVRAAMVRNQLNPVENTDLAALVGNPLSVVTTAGSGDRSGSAGGISIGEADDVTLAAPGKLVRYQGVTAAVKFLPKAGDLVDVAAGLGARQACQSPVLALTTAVAAAATGYLADQAPSAGVGAGTDCDRVDESMNGASQRRISVTSTVKAPS